MEAQQGAMDSESSPPCKSPCDDLPTHRSGRAWISRMLCLCLHRVPCLTLTSHLEQGDHTLSWSQAGFTQGTEVDHEFTAMDVVTKVISAARHLGLNIQ